MDFGVIKPIEASEEKIELLSKEIADIQKVLSQYADSVYGEPSVKRLFSDKHHVISDRGVKVQFDRLVELKPYTVGVFIRSVVHLATSFWRSHRHSYPHLDESDYLQEAGMAIVNAMYSYDGRNKFSTYVYHAVKNAMIDYVRRDKVLVYAASDSDDKDDEYSILDVVVVEEEKPDMELLRLAINDAALTSIETTVITAFLNGIQVTGEEFRQSLGVNPKNGKLYSRQWLSQSYFSALEKIKAAYLAREEKIAA